MGPPIFQVDAFADGPFGGNPAAVCLLDQPRETSWMQQVAGEMNLSETAFVTSQPDGQLGLRWFTPTVEVDLCGHATLATAHILWEAGVLAPTEPARFTTRSGVLTARQLNSGTGNRLPLEQWHKNRRGGRRSDWISLDFPAVQATPTPAPAGLAEALGARIVACRQNRMDLLVELDNPALVRSLQPNHAALARLPVRGVIVTAGSDDPRFDFVSRFFAPGSGVAEDPVTGSAHCCLAPFWGQRLNKMEMAGYQASARGGVVRVHWRGDRVELIGTAITVLRGELTG